ncbi:MAG: pseudouridylate synthase [Prevotella sp.]|nr:pseudouridylate synthase [Prevotella sp.]
MTDNKFPLYTEEQLRDIDIHELLPQQEPFVMIGCLTQIDEVRTVTETVISPQNIFVDDGQFSASGLIENIAQSCAARIGFVNKYILHNGIQIGVIGAVKNFQVVSLPKAGQTINTTVDTVSEVFGMTLAKATVTCEGEVLATTDIKIGVRSEEEKA